MRRRRGGVTRTYSKAKRRQGTENATEKWYRETYLDPRLLSGDLLKVDFERVRVILVHPDPTTKPKRRESNYTCDYYCINKHGETEMHEVKGRADEADRLKIKVAAEMFPEWKWYMAHVSGRKLKKLEEF